ncbi:MAG: pilus assembly protein PilM [Fuerstiella sp.]
MSETLVIEWDRDELIAATGAPSGSLVQLHAAIVVGRDDGNLTPAELGAKLKSSLSTAGISATEALVVFPRQLVTFHRIELPNLSDDEIPDMVRLQAATRLTVPVENVCLDFAPLPVSPGSETRDVLLVTAPLKHVNEVRSCLAVCGLELAGLRVSSFGIGASVVHSGLISRTAGNLEVEAIVSLRADSIELIFMTGHSVAFSHSGASWTSLDGVEQAVRSEISRARMAAAEDMGDYSVRRLILIGSPEVTAAVPDSVARRLNDAEVVRINPEGSLLQCRLPPDHTASDMLPLSGAIANAWTSSVEAVDLVNPRRTPERKDYGRLKTIATVGAVLLLLIAGWKWRSDRVARLQTEAADLIAERDDMRDTYKLAKNELLMARRLSEWSDRDISWLDQLQKIQQLMGSTDRVYIKRFKFGIRTGNYIGTIGAEGYAKSRRDIEDLQRTLTEAGYEVAPTEITQSLRDPKYAMELKLEVSIPVPKDEPKQKSQPVDTSNT